MRLLLTLLALLTGLATADRAVAAPAVPAAMGSLVLLVWGIVIPVWKMGPGKRRGKA